MFRKSLFLACMAVLALGARAHADGMVTSFTVTDTLPANTALVNELSGNNSTGSSVSYTVNSGSPNFTVYAVGASELQTYSTFPIGGGNLNVITHQLVAVFALQGVQTSGLPTLTASFTQGVLKVYDIGSNAFSATNPSTWTNGTLVYTAKVTTPQNTTLGLHGNGTGPQGAANQNLAAFNATAAQTSGALLLSQVSNPGTEFNPPDPFNGLQVKIQETNNSELTVASGFLPANSALDTAFQTIGDAIVPFGTNMPFENLGFAPDGTGANGDTVQSIGGQLYPVIFPTTPPPGVPEPASMLLWGGIAAAFGVYRARRSRLKKA